MLKTYQKLLIKQYIGPFVLTFFISVFILLMQFLWKYIDDLVGKGLEAGIIAELLMYASFSLVPMALPMAILLSSLMTFGNMGEHYELVAFKAAGISLGRVMRPLIVVSVFISIGAFFFSNNALPFANLKMKSLLYDVSKSKPTLNIKEGIFNNDITGYSLRVGKKSEDGKTLYNIMVYDHTDEMGNTGVILAERGEMGLTADKRRMVLNLYNGSTYAEVRDRDRSKASFYKFNRPRDPFSREAFKKMVIVMNMEDFGLKRTDENLFKDNAQMMNLTQLEQTHDTLVMELERGLVNNARNVLRMGRYGRFYMEDNSKTIVPNKIAGKKDILEGKSKQEKKHIYEAAANLARNAKATTQSNLEDAANLQKNINKHEIEWQRKFTLSFACFVLFFVAAPLGAIIRKGGLGLPLVVAIGLFVFFYVVGIMGEKSAKEDALSVFQGMWLANALFLPLGIYLTYKATTDSALFDPERYLKFFKIILERTPLRVFKNTQD